MASGFVFGPIDKVQATAGGNRRLRPWDTYEVKFVEAKYDTIKGKKDETKTYEMLIVRFESEDGYYEERIFNPGEKGNERFENTNKEGHKYYSASPMERLRIFIAQMLTVLNPDGMKKMVELAPKISSFKQLCEVFAKLMEPAKGKITHLKLVGRTNSQTNRVEPCLPKFAGVSKNGDLFTADNFIGDKLFFSPYEEEQKQKYLAAKPTNMDALEPPVEASVDELPTTEAPKEEIDDFEDLLDN
jgi:hypothetical protein